MLPLTRVFHLRLVEQRRERPEVLGRRHKAHGRCGAKQRGHGRRRRGGDRRRKEHGVEALIKLYMKLHEVDQQGADPLHTGGEANPLSRSN